MADDTADPRPPARPRRAKQAPDRPSKWPLAAIGGGLASAVLAGAAWTAASATTAPAPATHRTVRESEQAADTDSLDRAPAVAPSARASTAALAAVGSGTVVHVAAGPGGAVGGGYVVELTSASGSDVHVLVDDRFVVRSVRVAD